MILAICSPYLRNLLLNLPPSEEEFSITLTDISLIEMEKLMTFLYTGYVDCDSPDQTDRLRNHLIRLGVNAVTDNHSNAQMSLEEEVMIETVLSSQGTHFSVSSRENEKMDPNRQDKSSILCELDDDDATMFVQCDDRSVLSELLGHESSLLLNHKADLFGHVNSNHVENEAEGNHKETSLCYPTVDTSAIMYAYSEEQPIIMQDNNNKKNFSDSLSNSSKENIEDSFWIDISQEGQVLNLNMQSEESVSIKEDKTEDDQVKNTKTFSCSQCPKSFPSSHYLHFHEMSVHSSSNRRFVCSICQKRFSGAYYLRQHTRRMHSEVRKHVCDKCGSSFGVKYDLVVHKRTHEEEKMHRCHYCDKTYATGRALR